MASGSVTPAGARGLAQVGSWTWQFLLENRRLRHLYIPRPSALALLQFAHVKSEDLAVNSVYLKLRPLASTVLLLCSRTPGRERPNNTPHPRSCRAPPAGPAAARHIRNSGQRNAPVVWSLGVIGARAYVEECEPRLSCCHTAYYVQRLSGFRTSRPMDCSTVCVLSWLVPVLDIVSWHGMFASHSTIVQVDRAYMESRMYKYSSRFQRISRTTETPKHLD